MTHNLSHSNDSHLAKSTVLLWALNVRTADMDLDHSKHPASGNPFLATASASLVCRPFVMVHQAHSILHAKKGLLEEKRNRRN